MASLVKRAYATPEENQGRYEFARHHGPFQNFARLTDQQVDTLAAAVVVSAFGEEHQRALSEQCTRLAAELLGHSSPLPAVRPEKGDYHASADYNYYKPYREAGCRTKGEFHLEYAKNTALEHLDKLTDTSRTAKQYRKDPVGKKVLETFEQLQRHYYGEDSNTESTYAKLTAVFHALLPVRAQAQAAPSQQAAPTEVQERVQSA